MYSDILREVKTQREQRELVEEVNMLLESLYKVEEKGFDYVLDKKVKAWLAEALKEAFDKGGNKESYLRGLQEELKALESIKLTLGFEPSLEVIGNLHSWVQDNVGENVILDLSYNPSTLGGVIVSYKGRYQDFSLRNKLVEIFSKEKEEIISRLSKGQNS